MPEVIAQSIWADLLSNGTFTAFMLMLWTLALRFLLISFYFTLLYCGITVLKKRLQKKLSVRANYDCWYVLLLSVVLANLPFNNSIMVLPSYFFGKMDSKGLTPYAFFAVSLLSVIWFTVVIFKLAMFARMNRKIKNSMKYMEHYDDSDGLAERVVSALVLQRKPDIMIACYIETPVSFGVFKKTVLLPDNYEEKYSSDELYLLLLHEMTHIKHGDTVKLYMANLAECFLWITPVMRSFVKNFKRDSELLCDNRVIGLPGCERDTYGNLILKECVYKTARFGFGFSDSYHAVENRLDALYRYKTDKHMKMLAFIPAAILLICVLSFAFRTDYFTVNNTEYQYFVYDSETSGYVFLSPEEAELYDLEDEKIRLHHDFPTQEFINSYIADENIVIVAIPDNYTVQLGETNDYITNGGFFKNNEEADFTFDTVNYLSQRSFAEYVFLLIASKL